MKTLMETLASARVLTFPKEREYPCKIVNFTHLKAHKPSVMRLSPEVVLMWGLFSGDVVWAEYQQSFRTQLKLTCVFERLREISVADVWLGSTLKGFDIWPYFIPQPRSVNGPRAITCKIIHQWEGRHYRSLLPQLDLDRITQIEDVSIDVGLFLGGRV